MWPEDHKTRSKEPQSCNLLLKLLTSLERRTWEGKLFHNLVNKKEKKNAFLTLQLKLGNSKGKPHL